MTDNLKLFVTGASGFIGSRFCALARESGHEVVGLVRPSSAGRVPPGVQRVYGSLPYDVPESAVEQCDAIVHLAAVTTSKRVSESEAVNYFGTEYLLKLAQAGKKSFLFTSTQSAHGGNQSAYATTKLRSEHLVMNSGLEWAIIRPGLVYGPGNQGLFARMRGTVTRLPVLPLLGGGKALVQPIHVDDLCQALLSIVGNFSKFASGEFNLGDADGLPLKQFLQRISWAAGKKPRQLNVPIGPVKLAVATAEKLRVPLPISTDNLRGLQTVQRMDTAASLERLGLKLRDLDSGLHESCGNVRTVEDDRIPVVLIGAGKIGIIHGLQILHNPDARLIGIVEPSEKATNLYRSMGFDAPFYTSLEAVLAGMVRPLAAVVATPADTHLEVARKCVEANLSVLVEKPLSVNSEVAAEWRTLRNEFPDSILHSGYMAAQFPHLLDAYHIARMNKLGHIYKARAVALQTHITAAEPVRWEMIKARAGGGVMINFGCHVASILFRLLGWPDTEVRGWQWPIHSTEVEDAVVAKFNIKSTPCTLVSSWSVPGYARPYNLVELECEHGTIRVENSCVYVTQDGVTTTMKTQLDYDLHFNMAPDYTGGGFTLEHQAFISCVKALRDGSYHGVNKTPYMPAVEMPEALRLESWIRDLYESLRNEKPTADDLAEWQVGEDLAKAILSAGEQ